MTRVLRCARRMGFALTLLVVSGLPVRGQALRVGVEPRVELLSIVFRLAGNPEYSQGSVAAYDSAIEAHFAAHRDHPVVQRAKQLRAAHGVSFDAVMSFAVHITDAGAPEARRPFDAPGSSLEHRWQPEDARAFLADLRRFVADADFAGFVRSRQALYDTATSRARTLVERDVDLPWFPAYFGEEPRGGFVLAPGLANGGGNYGPKYRFDDGTEEAWAILGVWLTDSAGLPRFDNTVVSTVVHEFSHSFVNHVVAPQRTALAPAGERVFAHVEREMRSQAYSNWGTMIDESLVRASVARYVLAHGGPDAARREVLAQQSRGFVWMDGLFDLLGEYEAARDRYPTFASFMPRVVEWYGSLPARMDAVMAEFDAHRPVVVSVVPANGADAVDPATTAIVVRFDRRMGPNVNVNLGPGGRERFPSVEGYSFDEAGNVLTLRVRLEPERDYEFVLGSGFRSAEGYPIRPVSVRFRTGPTR